MIDGEEGIDSREAKEYLQTRCVLLRIRAPVQHARLIERRGAILRHSLHGMEEQLIREGIAMDFEQLFAEATFAGNAMVSYNGATPYNNRFGRQPAMLPDLTVLPEASAAGPTRDLQRVRELALQKIIESTALARIRRASRSMTNDTGRRDF